MWTCENKVCTWCPKCSASQHLLQCLSWTLWTPCNTMFWEAVGLAALSAVCNGSFTAFAKCSKVRNANVPGYIFNLWLCVGICFTSIPIALGTNLRCVSKEGALSGLLFVLSTAANIHAIQLIGLHQAVAIGCGTAALVSFAFGAVVENGSISHLPQALAGIGCLLAGMLAIALAGIRQQAIAAAETEQLSNLYQPTQQQRQQRQDMVGEMSPADEATSTAAWLQRPLLEEEYVHSPAARDLESSSATTSILHTSHPGKHKRGPHSVHAPKLPLPPGMAFGVHSRRTLLGLLLAVVTGVFGGLILAPMDYVGHECRGLPYQAALALGVLLVAPVVTYCIHWCYNGKVTLALPTQPGASAVPGILSGIIWTAGICSNMLATANIGLAIAYPIMQSGLFVAGLWGILLYRELYSVVPHVLYWSGGVILAAGAVLLTRAGQA